MFTVRFTNMLFLQQKEPNWGFVQGICRVYQRFVGKFVPTAGCSQALLRIKNLEMFSLSRKNTTFRDSPNDIFSHSLIFTATQIEIPRRHQRIGVQARPHSTWNDSRRQLLKISFLVPIFFLFQRNIAFQFSSKIDWLLYRFSKLSAIFSYLKVIFVQTSHTALRWIFTNQKFLLVGCKHLYAQQNKNFKQCTWNVH